MAWFRSSDEIDDEGFVIFVEDHGGPDGEECRKNRTQSAVAGLQPYRGNTVPDSDTGRRFHKAQRTTVPDAVKRTARAAKKLTAANAYHGSAS